MTTHDAAAELDVTRDQVCRLIREGKLKGRKVRGGWKVDGLSVRKLIRRRAQR